MEKVVLTKWFDNHTVVLASKFIGAGNEDEVERCDQRKRSFVKIQRPELVRSYNPNKGGVDKLDQLISLERTDIRSRKGTLRMITHAFDLAVVNSRLEYRRDKACLGIPQQYTVDLLHFKINVAGNVPCLREQGSHKHQGKEEDQVCHKAHHSDWKQYGKPLLNDDQLKISALT